jgi:hypothetical protein
VKVACLCPTCILIIPNSDENFDEHYATVVHVAFVMSLAPFDVGHGELVWQQSCEKYTAFILSFLILSFSVFRLSSLFRLVCEKTLLALSYPSVSLSVWPRVSSRFPLEEILWNFMLGTFVKICQQTPNLVKVGPKYRAHHMKTLVRLIVAGDIDSS